MPSSGSATHDVLVTNRHDVLVTKEQVHMDQGTMRSFTLREAGVTNVKVQWPARDDEVAAIAILSKRDLKLLISLSGGVLVVLFIIVLMLVPV
jgi:hypothetical protein